MGYSFSERAFRAMGKLVTWRIVQTIMQIIIAFIITGSIITGLKFAGLSFVVNTACYYLHERVWNKFNWARVYDETLGFSELQRRTIAKAITWKMIALADQWVIAFFITDNKTQSLIYALVITTVSSIAYWLHERAWNRLRAGKVVNTDDQTVNA